MQPENLEPNDSLPLTLRRRIDAVCTRFEVAWRQEPPPRIEDFLGDANGPEQEALLRELLRVELDCRRRRGSVPAVEDYLGRFRDQEQFIREVVVSAAEADTVTEPVPVKAPGAGSERDSWPVVSGYEVRAYLDKGGMGEVWRVHDPVFDRPLAVKVMLAKLARQPGAEGRFLAEARITGRLQHPGIPPVHEIGRLADGRPFLAMKLIKGHRLDELLKQRASLADGLPRFVAILGQVCQAVGYAHSQGVLHRDLKPHNVMVGAFGEVQVMDWGLAKERSSQGAEDGRAPSPAAASPGATAAGTVLGTAGFMAPEQARGEIERLDERADVFGLGSILCVILTGQPPFTGADKRCESESGNVAEAFARLGACGADIELIALARGCLAPDLEQRPRNAAEVAAAVVAYQAGVEERVRTAELARAAAQARAEEEKATAAAERRARRITRNLTAAVLVSLLLGASVATVFAIQASRKATSEKEARINLERTNTELTQSQEALLTSTDSLVTSAARILLHPFALNAKPKAKNFEQLPPLSDPEIGALWELASSKDDRLRLRFVEEAFREAATTRLLRDRAEVSLQATIGLNATRRTQIEELLGKRLRAKETTQEHQEDAALFLAHLGLLDRSLARRTASTLIQAMRKTTDHYDRNLLSLPKGLSALAARMEPKEAAQAAASLAEAIGKTRVPNALRPLSQELSAVAARMEPKDAAAPLTQAISKTSDRFALQVLSQGLSAATARMEPKDAALAAAGLIEAISKESNVFALQFLSQGLSEVAARMEPKEGAAVCGKAASIFTEAVSKNWFTLPLFSPALSAVAAGMEPKAGAATLIQAMSKTTDFRALQPLSQGLSAVAARMEPKEAAVVCGKAAATITQAMSKTTDPNALQSLSESLSAVAARMEPKEASVVCGQMAETLIRAMSKTTRLSDLQVLSQGLSALAARMEPKEAAQAVAALTDAMSPTTDYRAFQGLSALAARMEPKEAAVVCGKAASSLIQAMRKPTGGHDYKLESLSQGLSALAARMDPKEAALAAATLTEALGKTTYFGALRFLSEGLSALAARMEPKQAALAAAALTQARSKTTDRIVLQSLSQALSAVAARMEPKEAALAAATLTQAHSGLPRLAAYRPHGAMRARFALEFLSQGLSAVAARMEPKEGAATLIQAMSKTTDSLALQPLSQGLSAVAARMEPKEAAVVCGKAAATITQAMSKTTDPNALQSLSESLSAVAARMEPKEASVVCGQMAETLIRAMSKTTDPTVLQSLSHKMSAVLSREASTATRQRPLSVTAIVGGLGGPGMPFAALTCTQPALNLPPPLPAQTLVDLLKHPLCVGEPRRLVLGQLARRYDRPFADQWEFVAYVHKHKLDLDLLTPPQRPSRPLQQAPVGVSTR